MRRGMTILLAACLSLLVGCGDDDGDATADTGVNANSVNDGGTSGDDGGANNNNQNTSTDTDGDGVADANDCAPNDPTVYPGNTEVLGNGVDDDCDASTPDDCSYVHDSSLSAGENGDFLGMTEAHDYWRFRVGVPLASWNTAVAANAQAWADTCPSGHSTSGSRQNVAGFSYLGENIYFHSSQSADPVAAANSWASERADYDFGMTIGSTGAMIGHYTQMVWESSIAVGCGVARCSGGWGTIVVCQYGPGGNMSGQAPYGWSDGECLDLDNDDVLQMNDADDSDRSAQ